ncbi:hypothetical protein DFH11DRAFT_1141172 [Phellopilus nigrolimitatus]|nr:hypothetical protein DFH11DRAFT_1141172 [Phellopilus nigrolimitatus]
MASVHSTPSSISTPPRASEGHISAAALGDGASTIASFLKSVKPDLSAHLDTFLGLGIKDVEYIAAMRLWTPEHVKGFLDNGKFTPFEVHTLLHALFE